MEAVDRAPTWQEALFLFLCAAVLLWQLFLPGFIGLANNGDFPKVIGPLCIGATDNYSDNFRFFQAQYVRDPHYCYHPQIPASEILLVVASTGLQHVVQGTARFDIRWAAALHSLLFLTFYYWLLVLFRPLHPAARILLSLIAIWIFADVAYVSYLNSFFPDVAGILGALIIVILAANLLGADRLGLGALILFGLAALLFVTSKGPHAVVGIVPIVLLLVLASRAPSVPIRIVACVFAVALAAGVVFVLKKTPDWYKAQARYNLIFSKIVNTSKTPEQDLRELGLDAGYLRCVNTNAFSPNTPLDDKNFEEEFDRRNTYASVIRFYARHPLRACSYLWYDLWASAFSIRQANLSNYQRRDGHPPGATTNRMATWSSLRSWLFIHWPSHMILWYAIALFASPVFALRGKSRLQRGVAWTILGASLMGAGEFFLASLTDACETSRHLLLFHVFTDAAIFLALVFAATFAGRARVASPQRS